SDLVQADIVTHPAEVEVGDVPAVVEVRHLERDLAAETARPRNRLVEHLGTVGGPHKKDVVARRTQRRKPQRYAPPAQRNPGRNDEGGVQQSVDDLADGAPDGTGIVQPVHNDEQHVQGHHAAAEHPAHHAAATAHTGAATAQGIELVDEDGAAAPLLRALLGHA